MLSAHYCLGTQIEKMYKSGVLLGIILVVLFAEGSMSSLRQTRGVHVKLPSAGTAAVSGAVRSLKEKIEQQTEVLNRLANATEKLSESSGFFLRNCALTDKYGYTRIQLEEGSKPFDVFCEQALDKGGWTLVLQRFNGTHRTAQEFREGYNSIAAGEYFLGTDKLYALTHSRDHELLFVVEFVDRTTRTYQAQRFVLQSPTAHLKWEREQDTTRYSWYLWEQEIDRLPAGESWEWESAESCTSNLCGPERFIVFLLKLNFAMQNNSPIMGRPAIRLFKLLLRPSNAYWTVRNP
ncbi:angiopoietin-4 isoform X3 [Drosophila subpulchrella]|uniref:angiopoietin-4 isoform X3 n=1 Tax=Drosophila subpulchrella TaxID=1486046 RepID=UPI0018A12BC7|nr:angiopoietin-4 isoform X3 [Drosophila subpulchrella]